MHIGALRENFPRAQFRFRGWAHDPIFFVFLFLDDFLMLFKEIFEVSCDAHHTTVESVDAGLDGAFVSRSGLFWHVLSGSSDFFGINLDFSQFVLYLYAKLTDIVFSWSKKWMVLLYYTKKSELELWKFWHECVCVLLLTEVKLSLISFDIVNFEICLSQLWNQTFTCLSSLIALQEILTLAQIWSVRLSSF